MDEQMLSLLAEWQLNDVKKPLEFHGVINVQRLQVHGHTLIDLGYR